MSGGHLDGKPQTIGRAELTAVISAIRWTLWHGCHSHLWIDAFHIHEGLQFRLGGGQTAVGDTNADKWYEVDQLLLNGGQARITSSWIPSHLQPTLCESPFEEWVAAGNNTVDATAVSLNANRPPALDELMRNQRTWDDLWIGRLRSLRRYYFDVFADTRPTGTPAPISAVEPSEDESEGSVYSFSEVLTLDAFSLRLPIEDLDGFPLRFVHEIIQWIQSYEELWPCTGFFIS